MYKVYRDPEGMSVMPTQQTVNYTFQMSEETYREQIEKLREENALLKKKVSIIPKQYVTWHEKIGLMCTKYTPSYYSNLYTSYRNSVNSPLCSALVLNVSSINYV